MEPWVWIVIAVVVLIIIALIIVAMRKNSASAKRERANELREKAQERDMHVREREAAAAKTAAEADAARAEAEKRAAEAKQRAIESDRLAQQAHAKNAEYQEARSDRDDLLRRADEMDPDADVRDGQYAGRHADAGTRDPRHADSPEHHARHEAGRQGLDPRDDRAAVPTDGRTVDGPSSPREALDPRGDRNGDGHVGVGERAHNKVDDVRGRRDVDGDGRRG
ncbi:hypothetical protein [Cumulibacter manganitolerans]|uniref:hypothetical protein n=1 Tax=Cumulibacter manganitolerans TaxID=1884992 RepID=UPI001295A809|nr:hypothetical protein [Cumulibacter manganitolerans]